MDVFQSPLEAIAFNYVSFGFLSTVQSLLTCVAIVTAAISFWIIRAVGPNSFHRIKSSIDSPLSSDCRSTLHVSPPSLPVSTLSEPEPELEKEKPVHQEEQGCSSLVGVGAIEFEDYNSNDRIIKDKFTLYYDDENSTGGGEFHVDGDGADVVCSYREEPYNYSNELWSWDGILVGRGGDLGWYRSQDLTVLNGNVVRLWGCQRRRCLSPAE
ncbi:hypothetical protein NE237_029769 [Protea cynaroides]|uniref:Transmembrane protein n=1 Tax=Protea cynaroides TaxID=273540 RepID=A0A9Q0JVF0_9MAGN|nr:hypothetical protein NE237_029769 [Protea cynaroides]